MLEPSSANHALFSFILKISDLRFKIFSVAKEKEQ
jgi:hypothetical protein